MRQNSIAWSLSFRRRRESLAAASTTGATSAWAEVTNFGHLLQLKPLRDKVSPDVLNYVTQRVAMRSRTGQGPATAKWSYVRILHAAWQDVAATRDRIGAGELLLPVDNAIDEASAFRSISDRSGHTGADRGHSAASVALPTFLGGAIAGPRRNHSGSEDRYGQLCILDADLVPQVLWFAVASFGRFLEIGPGILGRTLPIGQAEHVRDAGPDPRGESG